MCPCEKNRRHFSISFGLSCKIGSFPLLHVVFIFHTLFLAPVVLYLLLFNLFLSIPQIFHSLTHRKCTVFLKIHSVLMISKNGQRHRTISSFFGNFIPAFGIDRILRFLPECFFLLLPLSLFSPPSLSSSFPAMTFLVTFFLSLFLSINVTNLFLSGGKNEMNSYSCDQNFIFLSRFLRIVNEVGPFSVICFIAPCRKPKIVVLYVIVL